MAEPVPKDERAETQPLSLQFSSTHLRATNGNYWVPYSLIDRDVLRLLDFGYIVPGLGNQPLAAWHNGTVAVETTDIRVAEASTRSRGELSQLPGGTQQDVRALLDADSREGIWGDATAADAGEPPAKRRQEADRMAAKWTALSEEDKGRALQEIEARILRAVRPRVATAPDVRVAEAANTEQANRLKFNLIPSSFGGTVPRAPPLIPLVTGVGRGGDLPPAPPPELAKASGDAPESALDAVREGLRLQSESRSVAVPGGATPAPTPAMVAGSAQRPGGHFSGAMQDAVLAPGVAKTIGQASTGQRPVFKKGEAFEKNTESEPMRSREPTKAPGAVESERGGPVTVAAPEDDSPSSAAPMAEIDGSFL